MPLELKMFSISSNRPVAMLSQDNSAKRQWTTKYYAGRHIGSGWLGELVPSFSASFHSSFAFCDASKIEVLRKGPEGKPNDQKYLWPSQFLLFSLKSLEMISCKLRVSTNRTPPSNKKIQLWIRPSKIRYLLHSYSLRNMAVLSALFYRFGML